MGLVGQGRQHQSSVTSPVGGTKAYLQIRIGDITSNGSRCEEHTGYTWGFGQWLCV